MNTTTREGELHARPASTGAENAAHSPPPSKDAPQDDTPTDKRRRTEGRRLSSSAMWCPGSRRGAPLSPSQQYRRPPKVSIAVYLVERQGRYHASGEAFCPVLGEVVARHEEPLGERSEWAGHLAAKDCEQALRQRVEAMQEELTRRKNAIYGYEAPADEAADEVSSERGAEKQIGIRSKRWQASLGGEPALRLSAPTAQEALHQLLGSLPEAERGGALVGSSTGSRVEGRIGRLRFAVEEVCSKEATDSEATASAEVAA